MKIKQVILTITEDKKGKVHIGVEQGPKGEAKGLTAKLKRVMYLISKALDLFIMPDGGK